MASFSQKMGSYDWALILVYLLLVGIGWVNIYSASYDPSIQDFLSLDNLHTKQLLFICLGILLISFILFLDSKFFERFSSIIYIVGLLSLILLLPLGKNINGATSWFAIGSFTLQPSEFAKAATALALAKYLSDIQTNIKNWLGQFKAFIIITLPALLILLQPDAGSALVYAAFIFPLYREGLASVYIIIGFSAVALFLLTLLIGPYFVMGAIILLILIVYFNTKKRRASRSLYFGILIASCTFVYSVNYIFYSVFEQHQRDRFNVVLGKNVDAQSIGYNTRQSEIAIGNGGWSGQGFLQGTQTTGKFVPEQDTDFIFSAVGEEWGFLGSTLVVFLFVLLILRIIQLSEKQKNDFSRPFFSYGGSGLWGFTILLFIFVKLDSNRIHEW